MLQKKGNSNGSDNLTGGCAERTEHRLPDLVAIVTDQQTAAAGITEPAPAASGKGTASGQMRNTVAVNPVVVAATETLPPDRDLRRCGDW